MIAVLSVAVTCWGLWNMLKPQTTTKPAESLKGILMEHIKYLPEVYQAHECYSKQLHNDTCALFIYRYYPSGCSPCYLDDLSELKLFQKTIGRDVVLALPAYANNDRNSRVRMVNEISDFRYRNIPADSLSFPIHNGEEKRYFAVIDKQGRIGMVFFPVKGRQDLTRRYFKEVASYFE